MRIALLGSRGIPSTYSGYETFFGELAPRLVERGHEVTVYCRSSFFPLKPDRYRGVRLIYRPSIETKTLSTPTHTLACMLDVLFREMDVIFVANVANAVFCALPRLLRKKIALNVDGVEWKRGKWSSIGRRYFYWSARLAGRICPGGIITDAVEMQRIYLEEFGARSVCIAYGSGIEASINSDVVRQYGLEPNKYYLILSRLVPENNAGLIIREFEQLHSDKLLAVVGDADYRSAFVDQVKRTRDSRVRFLGRVGNSDHVKELHCHCYAYIHGHSVGGTNPSLLTALGCSNLIFALDTPFNREVVGSYGILFTRDPADLTSKLQRFEGDQELAEQFRNRASQRIIERYTWKQITDQYEDYFGRLVEGENPALDRDLGIYLPRRTMSASTASTTA